MEVKSQRQKHQGTTLSPLDAAIEAISITKDVLCMTPAKAALGSVSIILTTIRDSMADKEDYVDLGLACVDVCRVLDRGMNGRRADDLSRPVLEAIEQLTTTVAEIQRKIAKWCRRNAISRLFHARNDKEAIATWRLDLSRTLHVFNAELAINTNVTVSDIRISTFPQYYERQDTPTLSMESAHDLFYAIYGDGSQSGIVSDLLARLGFHALSVALLATAASHSVWDYDRLAREWDSHRAQVHRTDYNESLAATIELSLTSPAFHELGPDARDLLGVVAFFPQGINENHIDWLFSPTSDGRNIFDNFCALSMTYRSKGFLTTFAPLRDYLCPKDPISSPLLCTIKDRYFRRLSVDVHPGKPGYEEAQWVTSEDLNIEHLLDIFTSIDVNSADVWAACRNFMEHLYWYKRRLVVLGPNLVVLGPKIEGLPDNHPSKPQCLFQLSWLLDSVGNFTGEKQLLTHALKLWKERGDDLQAAQTLMYLSNANRQLCLYEEGIPQAREALVIYERLNDLVGQAQSLLFLAWSLYEDTRLGAAEEAASKSIGLFLDKGEQFRVSQCHRLLGSIYRSKGEMKRAIHHFETALHIASPFDWHEQLVWNHLCLAELFFSDNKPDDAHAHVDRAKPHTTNDPYLLGRSIQLQALFWYRQRRFKEAKFETLRAVDIYEKIGATRDLEYCRIVLRDLEMSVTSGKSDFNARGTLHCLARLFRHILLRATAHTSGKISDS